MFEKYVTNALASPELVGDLRSYNRRLRTRSHYYKVIVILLVIFITLQYIGLFYNSNTQSANSSDLVYGGISNSQVLVSEFDNQQSPFSSVAQSLHISEKDLREAKLNEKDIVIESSQVIWSPSPVFKPTRLSTGPLFALKSNERIYYGYRLNDRYRLAPGEAYTTSQGKSLLVLRQTGNIITDWETAHKSSFCYTSPQQIENSYLHCPNGQNVRTKIEVKNLSYKTEASFLKSRPGDRLEYSLAVENTNNFPITFIPQITVTDILEYAHLENYSGAHFSKTDQTLTWQKAIIPPHATASHSFTIRVNNKTPLTPRGDSNLNSYDCQLSSFYGMNNSIPLRCPPAKTLERLLHFTPHPVFFVLLWVSFVISLHLYMRNRILYKESSSILRSLRRKP